MSENRFQAALHHAEHSGDWTEVISLYLDAAQGDAEAFNLTHAYVHALEAGDPRAPSLKARLVALGADRDDAP